MRAINTGNSYRIYDDDTLKVFAELPAQVYNVGFSKQSGFFLMKYANKIEMNEKIYGVHEEKVKKVLNSFNLFERNLGVILSGDKGIGKSLFAKLLSNKAIEKGYPLIIVDSYIPGIANFIEEIKQECVILFDEFDKSFGKKDDLNPQNEMLTLFDGISSGKKLFVITCNQLRDLNDYLVNRPGRFHYHFRFEYPREEEIREYLTDKLPAAAHKEIDKVVGFAKKVKLNYDCLRAIAFELSTDIPFETAITDLNIINVSEEKYKFTIYFKDGRKFTTEEYVDLFSDNDEYALFSVPDCADFEIWYTPSDNIYDASRGGIIIEGENLTFKTDAWFMAEGRDLNDEAKRRKEQMVSISNTAIDFMTIKHSKNKDIHYTV